MIVEGGALPTFLLERIAGATRAATMQARPPQAVVFRDATPSAEFTALLPLIAAENLRWRFVDAEAVAE